MEKIEYNPEIHMTTTKGKVLAKDKLGNYSLIDQKVFKENKHLYQGQTKGLTTAFCKETNNYKLFHTWQKSNPN